MLVINNIKSEDTSYTKISHKKIEIDKENIPPKKEEKENELEKLFSSSKKEHVTNTETNPQEQRSNVAVNKNINYRAKQIIVREGIIDEEDLIPVGTNFIGKLLTSIDTSEENQLIKVLLPYGGKHKNGGEIPKNSIIFGNVKYSGKGEKVFVQFTGGTLPEGKAFEIKAQALNSRDYSTGIVGEYHGKTGVRVATTLGLSMVSAMTNVLTEKESLGSEGFTITEKPTMKNAFYKGVSKVSEMEANNQAEELNALPEYVTVEAGSDLIVSLTESFKVR